MAVAAVEECLADAGSVDCLRLPMLLCAAEHSRPGRTTGIEDRLVRDITATLGIGFSEESRLMCHGRVGIVVALLHARELVYRHGVERVLVVATDSLVTRRTLAHYEKNHRLLTPANSNGFIPGEGASAFLVGRPTRRPELVCTGFGFAIEHAHIDSEQPLRADWPIRDDHDDRDDYLDCAKNEKTGNTKNPCGVCSA